MKVPAARAAVVKISRELTQDKRTSAYGEELPFNKFMLKTVIAGRMPLLDPKCMTCT